MKGVGWLKKTGKVIAYPVTKPIEVLARRAGEKAVDSAMRRVTKGLPMKNWQTSTAGWLLLAVEIIKIIVPLLQGGAPDLGMADATTTATGLGLLAAKDRGVTGAGDSARRM